MNYMEASFCCTAKHFKFYLTYDFILAEHGQEVLLVLTGFINFWSASNQLCSSVLRFDWLLAEAGDARCLSLSSKLSLACSFVRLAKFQELEQMLANIFEA